MDKVLLDVCCGRWGWSKEFVKRGWKCIGIDLLEHETPPEGCKLVRMNLLALTVEMIKKWGVTFAVASTPCEEFSVHGMKHFHPNASYPKNGINMFNHVRQLCDANKLLYVMENVRPAQQFVGAAANFCGPFYLWGNAVPPLIGQGFKKGIDWPRPEKNGKRDYRNSYNWTSSKSQARLDATAKVATIPPELAACVADYAERLLEARR